MRLHYIYVGKFSNSLENISWNVFQKGLLIKMLKDIIMIYQKGWYHATANCVLRKHY